jgi:hypothetical protein
MLVSVAVVGIKLMSKTKASFCTDVVTMSAESSFQPHCLEPLYCNNDTRMFCSWSKGTLPSERLILISYNPSPVCSDVAPTNPGEALVTTLP